MTHKTADAELSEGELDEVKGGIGLLLPAVQRAREVAHRPRSDEATTTTIKSGDSLAAESADD